MNRQLSKLSFLLCLFLLFSSLPAYGIEAFTSQPVYNGLASGQAHYSNIQFGDISTHWAKEAIQEMSAFSVMTGRSPAIFAPDQTLTYLEALAVLVRVAGGETAAQQVGEAQAPQTIRDIMILSAVDHWAAGYVQVAMDLGILTTAEADTIMNLPPQQREAVEAQIAARLEGYAQSGYSAQELANIQVQIRTQLQNNAIWNQPVSRQEVAVWIARILELDPLYSSQIARLYQFSDWQQVDVEKIPYVEAILKEGVMSGVSATSFSPKGSLTRAQMAQMIYNVHDRVLPLRGITKISGTIVHQENVLHQNENKLVYSLQNDNGSLNYLAVAPQRGMDFLVRQGTELGLSSTLRQWQFIEYYINPAQEVIFARGVPSYVTELEGTIDLVDVENRRLAILDYNDQRHLYDFSTDFPVQINGKDALLTDILYGQEVKLTLRDGRVVGLEGYLEEDPNLDGYIVPGSRVKVGDVLFASSQEIEIRTIEGREKYRVIPETRVLRNGIAVGLGQLKTGDRVILSFDDIYSADISEVRIEDDERHIQGVYRGTLESVNVRTGEMLLNNVSYYNQGSWIRHTDQKVLLKIDKNFYRNGLAISLQNLPQEVGKEVYAAVEGSYGVLRAAKVVVKEGSTQTFDSTVANVNFGINRMTVNNNYIYFNEGTIVISNDRLVDRLNLETAQTVHLTAELKDGVRTAAFVSIQYDGMLDDRIDGTRLAVYRGRITAVAEYGITLSRLTNQIDYLKLENEQWTSLLRPKQLMLTEDTYIFDNELEQEIAVGYFIRSRFMNPDLIQDSLLRTRIKNNYYVERNAFVVVKETTFNGQTTEEIVSINLTPAMNHTNTFVQNVHSAMGRVKTIDLDGESLELTDVRNWNTLSQRWETLSGDETISLEKAVILVNDVPVDRDTFYLIKPGAQVYLVKNKTVSTQDTAYVVVIEQ